jgi:methionine synthase II (cobalamin-independent)
MNKLLPTSVVGSYAWPSWLHTGLAAANRGEYGPVDIEELLNDAVDMAIRDQEDAGIDLISDGDEKLCKIFDVIMEKNMYGRKVLGIERSTFIIDPKGVLRKEYRKVKVDGHAEEVLAAVKELNKS